MTSPAFRVFTGLGLTVGLFGFGFAFSGSAVQARSWLEPTWRGRVASLPGSTERQETLAIDGEQTRVLHCRVDTRTPQQVLQSYRRLAQAQCGETRPYVESEWGDGGLLAWVDDDAQRLAVLVQAHPAGGASYQIFETAPPRQAETTRMGLPAGLATPPGAQLVTSSERADGTGFALLTAQGGVQSVAGRFVQQLKQHGFTITADTARALSEVGQGLEQVSVPFEGPDRRGILVVAGGADGAVRVTLTIREG